MTFPPREKGSSLPEHSCCDHHIQNGEPCCNAGHPIGREQAAATIARELGS